MELFHNLFAGLLLFVYHCFDRIVINGHLSALTRPENAVYFFREARYAPLSYPTTEEGASEFREFDAHLRRRLRAIIIHQKKRARFLYRHLVKRGAGPRQAAGTAYSRRGIWHRSNGPGMTKTYPNAWFATQWTSLYDLWCIANPPVEVSDQLYLVF